MKNKKWLLFILLISATVIISCKKYLDKQSDNSFVVPGTLTDLQALLDDADVMNEFATPSFGEASCDNYFEPIDIYNSGDDGSKATYTWQPHDYIAPNDWSSAYLPVYNSNYCLETLASIPMNSANEITWENVKGSALFFRAYYFGQLAWIHAKAYDKSTAGKDLGIALRLTSDFNVTSTRATVEETYQKIVADAKESVMYLPELPEHPYRPSKAAAYGLLARTYLSMRQYDSAFKYTDLCLGLQNALLNYNDASINVASNVPFQRFNKEIIFYTSMNGLNITPLYSRADTTLYDSYSDSDLRKQIFFRPSTGYRRFKGSYSASGSNLFSGIATDEMYLTRAECYARAGEVANALADLNTLISNRWNNAYPYMDITASNAKEALEKILTERRKELLYRGIRWMDIKRLNKEDYNIVLMRNINGNIITLPPNDNRYALPLPSDIIQQTGMQQNPQ